MGARRSLRKSLLISLAATLLLLGGCTKDKALALKAAAETFRDRSVSAIDNYQNLMVTGALGEAQPEAQQFQEVLAQLRAKGAQGRLTSADALAALGSIDARERQLDFVRGKLSELRTAYVAFAASLARLPEGSFLAGDAVACAAGLGVRLTRRMMDFAQASQDKPVRYQQRLSRAVGDLNRAIAAKNESDIQRAVGELIETRKAERSDNAAATAMFVGAIDAGMRTVALAQSYGQLSVEDLLSGLNQILEIRTATLGMDSSKAMERLATFRTKLEQDPALKPILAIPLNEPIPACKGQ